MPINTSNSNNRKSFSEITFTNIKNQIQSFLQTQYSKASVLFSTASPFGQILTTFEYLHQLSMMYIKNTIKQYDLSNPNANNTRIVRNAAITSGHNPGRSISATGTLKFSLMTNIDVQNSVPGGSITVFNRQTLTNKTNGLYYSLNLGADQMTIKVNQNTVLYFNLIQGQWQKTTFTGTGDINQTYQVSLRGNQKDIENFNIQILVNGTPWQIKAGIYDLLPNEQSCVVRTGFNNGIDIIFGNNSFGMAPGIGDIIEVDYISTDGSIGNIFRRTTNDWTFVDPALDGFGNTIDLTTIFNIDIFTDINFGADKESIVFTKNILPIVSQNFVLGLPQQFAAKIKSLGVFTYVNAYQQNGVIYIVACPNIQLFTNQNADYFTVDISAFSLDQYEISKISTFLNGNGNILLTSKYLISPPVLTFYVLNVFVVIYSDVIVDTMNTSIINAIGQYFLNISDTSGRIPVSDMVQTILNANSNDIYSVDCSFISQDNEVYHANAMQADQNRRNQYATSYALQLNRPSSTYNPNATIGLDPTMGDIIFTPDTVPVIRGGWYDRNGVFYSANINDPGLKSVNIFVKGTVDKNLRSQI